MSNLPHMAFSPNLPMIVINTFEHSFTYHQAKYPVLFEGKSQTSRSIITHWYLKITHPARGTITYILNEVQGQWKKCVGINSLEVEEEQALFNWAVPQLDRKSNAFE